MTETTLTNAQRARAAHRKLRHAIRRQLERVFKHGAQPETVAEAITAKGREK